MRPKFFFITAFVAVWGFLSVNQAFAQTPNEQRLKVIATVATGRTIDVFCERSLHPNIWGWRKQFPRSVTISQIRCDQLEALANGLRPRAKAKYDFAEALGILLSGANSASGLGGHWEGVAISSCKAIQQLESAAKLLTGAPHYPRDLAIAFAKRGYWNVPLLFPSTDCYPGGPMDFNLGWWPSPQPPPPGYGKGGVG